MITALGNRLARECKIVKDWYPDGVDLSGAKTPFGVIRILSDIPSLGNSRGYWESARLWVYVEKGSKSSDLKRAFNEIRGVLDNQKETNPDTGESYIFEVGEAGLGMIDPDLDLYGRSITVRAPVVRVH